METEKKKNVKKEDAETWLNEVLFFISVTLFSSRLQLFIHFVVWLECVSVYVCVCIVLYHYYFYGRPRRWRTTQVVLVDRIFIVMLSETLFLSFDRQYQRHRPFWGCVDRFPLILRRMKLTIERAEHCSSSVDSTFYVESELWFCWFLHLSSIQMLCNVCMCVSTMMMTMITISGIITHEKSLLSFQRNIHFVCLEKY